MFAHGKVDMMLEYNFAEQEQDKFKYSQGVNFWIYTRTVRRESGLLG